MLKKIKNKIDSEIPSFLENIDKAYHLKKISPLLFSKIRNFVLRDGKRIRPVLFIAGYRGFSKKAVTGLYTIALAVEFLHDFMLVHDDIIDKSDIRRGKPSMHKMFNDYLAGYRNIKFSGEDLAIAAGDIMYAMAIDAFLAVNVDYSRKEKALKNFIRAAIFTGSGEFIEILGGTKNIEKITKNDIYRIYDYKTAHYTFACPLSTGAILAGAGKNEVEKLFQYGIYLGRAFQIKDDILGIFGDEKEIGKSTLSDLQEAKKTLLIWHAYNNSNRDDKSKIKKIFTKTTVDRSDLSMVKNIMQRSKTLSYAKKEINHTLKKANSLLESSKINKQYKKLLLGYSSQSLDIP